MVEPSPRHADDIVSCPIDSRGGTVQTGLAVSSAPTVTLTPTVRASIPTGHVISVVKNLVMLHGWELHPDFLSERLTIRRPLLAEFERDLEVYYRVLFPFMLCARPNQEQGNCGYVATVTIDTTTSYTLHSRSVLGTRSCISWEVNVTQCTPRTVTVTTAGLGALYDPPTLRLIASFVGLTHGAPRLQAALHVLQPGAEGLFDLARLAHEQLWLSIEDETDSDDEADDEASQDSACSVWVQEEMGEVVAMFTEAAE